MTFLFAVTIAAAVLAPVGIWLWSRKGRKRLAQDLDAAREIVDFGNDPVLVADIVEGQILYANPAACSLLGYERQALLERRLPDLHPQELVERSAEAIADVWEKRGLVYSDLPFVRHDGERVDVEVSANVLDFRGQPAVLIYARDIRERLQAERKIRDYASQLEQTNRELRDTQAQLVQSEKMAALGNLVAGVAHEINTPIASIYSNADIGHRALELLKSSLPASTDDKKLRKALTALEQTCQTNQLASERISKIVQSLRNFARLDEAEEKQVDLHEGIDSTLRLLQHKLKKGINVVKRYGDLSQICCFPNQLNQVFMNLLVNAIHAVEGEGTITIITGQENGQAVLRFADNGVGIAAEQLDQIFDPGYTTKGVGVGTGLGLSICYRIMQQHGGRIEVTSKIGEGTEFTLRLPLSRAAVGA